MKPFLQTIHEENIERCHRMIPVFRDIKNGVVTLDHCTPEDAAGLLAYSEKELARSVKEVARYEQEARDAAEFAAFKAAQAEERLAS